MCVINRHTSSSAKGRGALDKYDEVANQQKRDEIIESNTKNLIYDMRLNANDIVYN